MLQCCGAAFSRNKTVRSVSMKYATSYNFLIILMQVMVPGKTHLSLTVAWALDHDPVAAVKQASAQDAIPEDEAMDLHEGNMVLTFVQPSSFALELLPVSARGILTTLKADSIRVSHPYLQAYS